MQLYAEGSKLEDNFAWRFKYRGDHAAELKNKKKRGVHSKFMTEIGNLIEQGNKPQQIGRKLRKLYEKDEAISTLLPTRKQIAAVINNKKTKREGIYKYTMQTEVEEWANRHMIVSKEQYDNLGKESCPKIHLYLIVPIVPCYR
jgi:hypothetical protein